MTLVLPFNFAMPCGFNGDAVGFEPDYGCGGASDWVVTSPTAGSSSSTSARVVDNLDGSVGNYNFTSGDHGRPAAGPTTVQGQECERRQANGMELDDDSVPEVAAEVEKARLLAKCDERMGVEDAAKLMAANEPEAEKRKQELASRDDDSEDGDSEDEEDDEEEEEELFFQPPRRISMLWSSKFRWREERKKVFKMSINKLRRIEDPELFLRRSVLINNTVKRLHREIREEKMARYPDLVPRCSVVGGSAILQTPMAASYSLGGYSSNGGNNSIPEAYPKKRPLEYRGDSFAESVHISQGVVVAASGDHNSCTTKGKRMSDSGEYSNNNNNLDQNIDPAIVASPPAKRLRTCGGGLDELNKSLTCRETQNGSSDIMDVRTTNELSTVGGAANCRRSSGGVGGNRCDVESLVPTTTTPLAANNRINDRCDQSPPPRQSSGVATAVDDKLSTDNYRYANNALQTTKDRRDIVSEIEKQYSQYSCGQLSIFGELQSVVFHSLIASLES